MFIDAIDDGDTVAQDTFKKKLEILTKVSAKIQKAVKKDKSKFKDPRTKMMAEFLMDISQLNKTYKEILSAKNAVR